MFGLTSEKEVVLYRCWNSNWRVSHYRLLVAGFIPAVLMLFCCYLFAISTLLLVLEMTLIVKIVTLTLFQWRMHLENLVSILWLFLFCFTSSLHPTYQAAVSYWQAYWSQLLT